MKRIVFFFGGRSTEHTVSLQSAHGVLTHLDTGRYTPLMVGITREGRWLYYTGPVEDIPSHGREQSAAIRIPAFGAVFLRGEGRFPRPRAKKQAKELAQP